MARLCRLKLCAIRRCNDVVSCYVIVLQASRTRVRDRVDSRPQSRLVFLAASPRAQARQLWGREGTGPFYHVFPKTKI